MTHSDHAAVRAAERYGVHATPEQWTRAVLDIIDAVAGDAVNAVLLRRRRTDREEWLVRLAGEPLIAIYRPETATIITVLPYGAR